jgi:CheY-like chemotaxis protein
MNGWMLLSLLKADAAFANTPLIMVAMAEQGEQGLVLEVDTYLSKPIERDYLRLTLRRYHHQLVSTKHKSMGKARIVQKEHWEVRTAPDGDTALEMLAHQAPDLLFLNLSMPQLDSIQLLTQLRNHPQWQSIPIVMLVDKELPPATCQQLTHSTKQRLQHNPSERQPFLRHLINLVTSRLSGQSKI